MTTPDQALEAQIQAAGADKAPRITPADIEANIVDEVYFTALDGYAGTQPGKDYYQFDMTDGEGNEIEDWWSDSIIAWAHYPAEPARVALETEKKRQAAA